MGLESSIVGSLTAQFERGSKGKVVEFVRFVVVIVVEDSTGPVDSIFSTLEVGVVVGVTGSVGDNIFHGEGAEVVVGVVVDVVVVVEAVQAAAAVVVDGAAADSTPITVGPVIWRWADRCSTTS